MWSQISGHSPPFAFPIPSSASCRFPGILPLTNRCRVDDAPMSRYLETPQAAQHRPRPVHRGPADLPIWHTREPGRRAGPRCAEKARRGDRETRSLDRALSARSLLRDLEALAPSHFHCQPWASRACTCEAGSDWGMIRACPPHESSQCPEIWVLGATVDAPVWPMTAHVRDWHVPSRRRSLVSTRWRE